MTGALQSSKASSFATLAGKSPGVGLLLLSNKNVVQTRLYQVGQYSDN